VSEVRSSCYGACWWSPAAAQRVDTAAMTAGTRWDGSALGEAIATWHPHPFRYVPADEFAPQVDAAERQVAGGDRSVAVVELMRLVALLGNRNGHTVIFQADDHPDPLHLYPIAPYEFEDGVFVVASAVGRDLVGFELEAVAGVPVEELLARLEPLVARDNEWTVRARRPLYLVTAEVLRGLLQASESAPFDLRGRSGSVRVVLDPVPAPDWYARLRDAFPAWDPRLPRRTELMFRGGREGPHWTATLRNGEAAYIAYELTRGDLTGFAGDVDALVGQLGIAQVLLDLRLNGGGDNTTYGPLLEVLEHATHELGKRLRVLIGRSTFSAAMQLVVDLERRTPAQFVGEPTGGSPNHYGDARQMVLTDSRLVAYVPTVSWTTAGEGDERLALEPDLPVPVRSDDYFAGRDPALEAALD
jgi:hypothetical protein